MNANKLKTLILDLLCSEATRNKPLTLDELKKYIPEQIRNSATTKSMITNVLKQLQKSRVIKETMMGYKLRNNRN